MVGERSNRMIMVESIKPAAIYGLGKLICTSPTSIVLSLYMSGALLSVAKQHRRIGGGDSQGGAVSC